MVPVLFWNYLPESSNALKWILLSAALPFFLKGGWSRGHTIGAAFLVWCCLSLFWAPTHDAIYRLWQFTILALAFYVGTGLERAQFRYCVIAFGAGVVVSVPLMFAQMFGFDWVNQTVPPAGLFMNKNYLAEACLIAAVGLVCLRHWLCAPLFAGVVLPASTGVFLACATVLARRFHRYYKVLIVAGLVLGAIAFYRMQDSEAARISLWANSMASVTFQGQGIGSFWVTYPQYHDAVMETDPQIYRPGFRPRTAHNDALTVLAETGVPGLVLVGCFFGFVLTRRRSTYEQQAAHYMVVAFLACGLVAFPLYVPSTAFIAFLAAGYLCGRRGVNGGVGVGERNQHGRLTAG